MVRHHIKKAANSLTNYSKKTANLIGSKLYLALAMLAWPVMEFMIKLKIYVPDPYKENNPSDPYANLKALEKECKKNPDLLKNPKGPPTVGLSLKFRNALGHIDFRKFTNQWKDYLKKWAEMAVLVGGNAEAKEILQVEKEIDEIIAADEAQKVEQETPQPEVTVPEVAEIDVEEAEVDEPESAQPEDTDEPEVDEPEAADEPEVDEPEAADEPEVDEPEVRVRRRRSRSRRSKSRRVRPDGSSG